MVKIESNKQVNKKINFGNPKDLCITKASAKLSLLTGSAVSQRNPFIYKCIFHDVWQFMFGKTQLMVLNVHVMLYFC